MGNYIKLLKFLKGHEKTFVLASTLIVISSIFEGVQLSMMVPLIDRIFTNKSIILPNKVPQFLSNIVDFLNRTPPMTLMVGAIIIFMVLLIIKHLVGFAHSFLMNNISQKIMRDIRYRLYSTIQNLSLDYFSKKRGGELVSRITNDVQIIENAISYGVTDLFRQTFMIFILIS